MQAIKENGFNGQIIQVFVPNKRYAAVDTLDVTHANVVRFSTACQYEFDNDGIRIPIAAGTTMGIPYKVEELRLYDLGTGATLTPQALEVM